MIISIVRFAKFVSFIWAMEYMHIVDDNSVIFSLLSSTVCMYSIMILVYDCLVTDWYK